MLSIEEKSLSQIGEDIQIKHIIPRYLEQATIWSPNSNNIIVNLQEHPLSIFNLSTKNLTTASQNDISYVDWISENAFIVFDSRSNFLPEINALGETTNAIDLTTIPMSTISHSHNGEYISFGGYGGSILNMDNRHFVRVDNLVNNYGAEISPFYFKWHSTKNWTFMLDAPYPNAIINIIDANGEIQRYLTECAVSPSCFGWMPTVE